MNLHWCLGVRCSAAALKPPLVDDVVNRVIPISMTCQTVHGLVIEEVRGTIGNDAGLDANTKDLDLPELHAHLWKRFLGDPSRVKDWYQSEGFLCGYPLLSGYKERLKQMGEEEAKARFLEDFGPLAARWAALGLVSEAFTTSSQILANLDRWGAALAVVRYIDGKNGNAMWRNRWAKQARGTVLFVNPEDLGDVRVLSFKLPRGAEVKSFLHTDWGVEKTQDFEGDAYSHLDDWTIKTCDCLRVGGSISGYLSFKGDGALFTLTLATGRAAEVWQPILELCGGPWVKAWNQLCRNVCVEGGIDEALVLIPATNGVAIMEDFMVGYMTTGILVGTGAATRDGLLEIQQEGGTAADALLRHGTDFVRSLVRFRLGGSMESLASEIVTLSFEVIVCQQKGLFNDHYHAEMAVSYGRDRALFLGASCCTTLQFYPHYCFQHPFEEPLFWPVSHSDDVARMLAALEKLARKEITKEEFFADCPPAAVVEPTEDAIIDYEGWVFHVMDPCNASPKGTKGTLSTSLYTKIKTAVYYRFHKLSKDLEQSLEVAPLVQHAFPKAGRLLEVFAPGALHVRMARVMDQVKRLLNFRDPENVLLARMRADEPGQRSPLDGFETRPYEVQCKIAINAKTSPFGQLLTELFAEEFSFVKEEDRQLKVALKAMVMKMEPWADVAKETSFDPSDPVLEPLITACLRGA